MEDFKAVRRILQDARDRLAELEAREWDGVDCDEEIRGKLRNAVDQLESAIFLTDE